MYLGHPLGLPHCSQNKSLGEKWYFLGRVHCKVKGDWLFWSHPGFGVPWTLWVLDPEWTSPSVYPENEWSMSPLFFCWPDQQVQVNTSIQLFILSVPDKQRHHITTSHSTRGWFLSHHFETNHCNFFNNWLVKQYDLHPFFPFLRSYACVDCDIRMIAAFSAFAFIEN